MSVSVAGVGAGRLSSSRPTTPTAEPPRYAARVPKRVTSCAPIDRGDDRGDPHRDEVRARLERAVAVDLLQVERGEEEHAEEGGAVERERDRGDAQPAHAEEPQRDERVGGAGLDGDERAEQDQRPRRRARAPRPSPSPPRRCG